MTEVSKDFRLYLIAAAKICEKSLKAAGARLTLNKKEKMLGGLINVLE